MGPQPAGELARLFVLVHECEERVWRQVGGESLTRRLDGKYRSFEAAEQTIY
ncbi:MAG: hypothetical protein GX601_14305 [Anaerolineales bacterium]|nr:hypothetical protein [Anaerolineales bacterium]